MTGRNELQVTPRSPWRQSGRTTLSVTSRIRLFYLLHISKPHTDRLIYQAIDRYRVRAIVELGMADGMRALRMIEVASHRTPPNQVSYTGVDLFEAGSVEDGRGTGITLRAAHRLLHPTGVRARLLPGDPCSVLVRTANQMGKADLLVISSGLDIKSLAEAWYYVPRMLHARSQVFVEKTADSTGQPAWRRLSADQVQILASKAARLRRAA